MKLKSIILLTLLALTNVSLALSKGSRNYTANLDGLKMRVMYNIPAKFKADTKVLFVMHGVKRNADTYRDAWKDYSDKHGFILLVPEFDSKKFPGSNSYNLANMNLGNGKVSDKEKWSFSLIEKIFQDVRKRLKLTTSKYHIYGHSAGAQFVHRFAIFYPEASLDLAIAANAGWYTALDTNILFPYGVNKIKLDPKVIFNQRLVVLIGSRDNDPKHKYLRTTKEAMLQGKHRLARAHYFYDLAKKKASELKLRFNWQFKVVDGVAHSNSGMAKEAIKHLMKK